MITKALNWQLGSNNCSFQVLRSLDSSVPGLALSGDVGPVQEDPENCGLLPVSPSPNSHPTVQIPLFY